MPSNIQSWNPTLTHYFDDFEYTVNFESLTWEQHQTRAERWGGNLVSIKSSEENDFIMSLVANGGSDTYWLGGVLSYNETYDSVTWKWVDGVTISGFVGWESEPSVMNGNRLQFTKGGIWLDIARSLQTLHSSWCYDGKRILNGPAIYKRVSFDLMKEK